MSSSPYDYALLILSRTPKTVAMMTQQLLKKWYNYDQTQRTIEALKSDNYLNDEAFCEAYIRSEVINKWRSLNLTKKKLYQKWMPQDIINATLEDLEEEIDEVKISHLAREIRKLNDRWDDVLKIYQKLSRRGYVYDDIKVALEYMNDSHQ